MTCLGFQEREGYSRRRFLSPGVVVNMSGWWIWPWRSVVGSNRRVVN